VSLSEVAFPGRREFLRGACAVAGFEPRIVQEVDSVALLFAAVTAGDAVAIAPRHSQKLPHQGCVFVPLGASAPVVQLFLATGKEAPSTELQALGEVLVARSKSLGDG